MMQHHMAYPYSYNEVVVDTASWVDNLPRTLEAVYFQRGDAAGEQRARAVYGSFKQIYSDAPTLLLSMDLTKLDAPFEIAS